MRHSPTPTPSTSSSSAIRKEQSPANNGRPIYVSQQIQTGTVGGISPIEKDADGSEPSFHHKGEAPLWFGCSLQIQHISALSTIIQITSSSAGQVLRVDLITQNVVVDEGEIVSMWIIFIH